MTVDVGKIFIDENGAGRLYIPREVMEALGIRHKERVRLKAVGGRLNVVPLDGLVAKRGV